MTIKAGDENRLIGGKGIYPFFTRKLAAPAFVVPITAPNPAPGGQFRGLIFNALGKLLWSCGVAQINRQQMEAAFNKMGVVVYETGQRKLALQINDAGLGVSKFFNLCRGADGNEAFALRRQGFGPDVFFIARPDAPID